jgi:DNA-binding transcriptional LysR family regulator
MEQQKTQILRINAKEATLNAQLVQNIASFSENYHDLNLTLSSRQASLAYGETDIILTHVAPTEGRIIRKKVGDLCVRAYRNAMLEAPTTGWIATAHGVDEAVETSDIFVEFGDVPQFTLHSLDMTVEVMRTSVCAALLPARYAERFAHLDVMEHIPEQSLPVWACYHDTRKTDQIIKDALDWIEQSFHRLQLSKFGKFFADIAHKWF